MQGVRSEEAAWVGLACALVDGEAATRRGRARVRRRPHGSGARRVRRADRDTPLGEVDLDAVARAYEPHALRVDPRGAAVGPVGEQHAHPVATGFEDEQADRTAGPAAEWGEHARRAGGARRGPCGGAARRAVRSRRTNGWAVGERASSFTTAGCASDARAARRRRAWQRRGREYEGRERREEEGGGARGHLNRSLRRPLSGPGGRGRERCCGGCGPLRLVTAATFGDHASRRAGDAHRHVALALAGEDRNHGARTAVAVHDRHARPHERESRRQQVADPHVPRRLDPEIGHADPEAHRVTGMARDPSRARGRAGS